MRDQNKHRSKLSKFASRARQWRMNANDNYRLYKCNFKVEFGNLRQASYTSTENLFKPSNRKGSQAEILADMCKNVGLEFTKSFAPFERAFACRKEHI